jgi:hypothetical protein
MKTSACIANPFRIVLQFYSALLMPNSVGEGIKFEVGHYLLAYRHN